MDDDAAKERLARYLSNARAGVLWKLEGLGEYDVRRPMTPTGTNLLGLVRHLTEVEGYYVGDAFDRPFPEDLLWRTGDAEDADDTADLWVAAEVPVEEVVDRYRRAAAHADATIAALPLDAVGHVPWWDDAEVTLHSMLVHVLAEVARHAGHADIVREEIDGAAGMRPGATNLPDRDADRWRAHREQVEHAARAAATRDSLR